MVQSQGFAVTMLTTSEISVTTNLCSITPRPHPVCMSLVLSVCDTESGSHYSMSGKGPSL